MQGLAQVGAGPVREKLARCRDATPVPLFDSMLSRLHCEQKMDNIFQKLSRLRSDAWNLDPYRWDWSCGVGLLGVGEGAVALDRGEWREFLASWFERVAEGTRVGSVNHVAPANVLLLLEGWGDAQRYAPVCDRYARWCRCEASRTSNGGWAHVWEGGDQDYCNQLWVDTVFMAATFLARYGLARGDEAAVAEALSQVEIHLDCLFDRSVGLFRHAYHCERKVHLGEHWGRGNGWMVASLVQLLDLLSPGSRSLEHLKCCFTRTMQTGFLHRCEGGLIRTLPLVPEAYLETTGSALFGYAALRGYKLGLLPEQFRDWGLRLATTVGESVNERGEIPRCSHGTNPDPRSVYLGLPFSQSLYADGIVLMLLAQAHPLLSV